MFVTIFYEQLKLKTVMEYFPSKERLISIRCPLTWEDIHSPWEGHVIGEYIGEVLDINDVPFQTFNNGVWGILNNEFEDWKDLE